MLYYRIIVISNVLTQAASFVKYDSAMQLTFHCCQITELKCKVSLKNTFTFFLVCLTHMPIGTLKELLVAVIIPLSMLAVKRS